MGEDRNDVIEVARTSRSMVKYLAGAVGLFFVWLEFKGLSVGKIIGSVSGDLLVKAALSLYYLSWVAGTINDVDEQETVYTKAPNQGRFPRKAVLLGAVIAVVFAGLCFVTSARAFGVILVVFLITNVLGFLYLKVTVSPTIETSRSDYIAEGDPGSLIKLEIVRRYLFGTWQWYRFAYGFAAAGVVMAASFTRLPEVLNSLYPTIPSGTYMALSVLLYVITFEGWIWAMRIWTRAARSTVDFVIEKMPELNRMSPVELPLLK